MVSNNLKKGVKYTLTGFSCLFPIGLAGVIGSYVGSKIGHAYSTQSNNRGINKAYKKETSMDSDTNSELTDTVYLSEAEIEKVGGEGLAYVKTPTGETVVRDVKVFKQEPDQLLKCLEEEIRISEALPDDRDVDFELIKEAVNYKFHDEPIKRKLLANNASELKRILDHYEEKGIIITRTDESDTNVKYYDIESSDFSRNWVFHNNKIIILGEPGRNYSQYNKLRITPRKHYKSLIKYLNNNNTSKLNKLLKEGDEVMIRCGDGNLDKRVLTSEKLNTLKKEDVILPPNVLKAYNHELKYEQKNAEKKKKNS